MRENSNYTRDGYDTEFTLDERRNTQRGNDEKWREDLQEMTKAIIKRSVRKQCTRYRDNDPNDKNRSRASDRIPVDYVTSNLKSPTRNASNIGIGVVKRIFAHGYHHNDIPTPT
jgi:hypothetical protein